MARAHHVTQRAAALAFERGQITEQSRDAVISGSMTLQEARQLGVDAGPTDTPEGHTGPPTATETPGRASAEQGVDTPKTCLCGCGEPVSRTFRPGHDSRLRSELVAQIMKGDVLLRSERITP